MNRIYRLVWNRRIGGYVAAGEHARGHRKSGRSGPRAGALLAGVLVAAGAHAAPGAGALPTGGRVSAGSAQISAKGNTMTVQENSQSAAIDWQSFSVGSAAQVDFLQPNAAAVILNRVVGNQASVIDGMLSANGQVFLLNAAGVLIGKGASIDAQGFLATTLGIGDADFMAGKRTFAGNSNASIINLGTISARDGGYAALLGAQVINQGLIVARLGTAALAAGERISLNFNGDSLLGVAIEKGALAALVANRQAILADGGTVILTAKGLDSVLAASVNNTGLIQAQTIGQSAGHIYLLGDMQSAGVNVGGTLDASAPNGGNGGDIETSAATVHVENGARITTAARAGLTGSWLVDPQDFTIAPSGGDITGATLSAELGTTNVSLQSSSGQSAGSGNLNVNDTVSWSANTLTLTAANNININSVMTITGTGSFTLNPGTANGADAAVSGGTLNFGLGANGFYGRADFSGTGTLTISGNVYTVINALGSDPSDSTGATLQGMQGNLSGYYALGSNIDASATGQGGVWGSAGFTPIGSTATPFSGTFNGLGHTIGNLLINNATLSDVGLFGVVTGTISNVGLVGGSVTATLPGGFGYGTNVGALAGSSSGATINNSFSTAPVSAGAYANVGGLVGNAQGGVISNSFVNASVYGGQQNNLGGLVGFAYGTISNSHSAGAVGGMSAAAYGNAGGLVGINFGTITNSYSVATVTAGTGTNAYVGGLVGSSVSGSIAYSYSSGAVNGGFNTGGLAGQNAGTITDSYSSSPVTTSAALTAAGLVGYNVGSISNSYAVGSVTAPTSNVGGLVGFNYGNGSITTSYASGPLSSAAGVVQGLVNINNGTVTNSYWNTTTTGTSQSPAGTGLTTAQMQTASNLAGFTFTTTPGASGNAWVLVDIDSTLNNANGAAGATLPMLASEYSTTIANAHQLQLMNMSPGASYTLNQNVDATATNGTAADVWAGSTFIPIGSISNPFTGTLDGRGLDSSTYTVSNLTIDLPAANYVGLVGAASGGLIQNLNISGANVSGASNVGALVGYTYGTTILGVQISGSTVSGSTFVGGLGGQIVNTTLANDVAGGSVTGTGGSIGGLVGSAQFSSIAGSSTSGSVTGSNSVGGVAGYGGAAFVNDQSSANVSGTGGYEGGLVGYLPPATISGSSTSGNVTGAGAVGGIAGGSNGASITASSSSGNILATSSQAGGIVGPSYDSTISNSSATGNISAPIQAGGIAGWAYGSSLSGNHTSLGTVSGANQIGGLFGWVQNSTVTASSSSITVTGTGSIAGGLVGVLTGGAQLSGSYASGSVNGVNQVGGLVGAISGTAQITNSHASGSVGGATQVGGLVGIAQNSTIAASYSTATVTGTASAAGGLVGELSSGAHLDGSYASGAVTGVNRVGGIAGELDHGAQITNSYANGTVTGVNQVGGLVGDASINGPNVITNAYFAGTITATGNEVGGLVGTPVPVEFGAPVALTNAFYDVAAVSINGTHLLTAGGLYDTQYQAWFGSNASLALKSLDIANYASTLPCIAGCTNPATATYGVGSAQSLIDLLGFAELGNAGVTFKLTSSIDLAAAPGLWIPYLAGNFDGGGFSVANVSVNQVDIGGMGATGSNIGFIGIALSSVGNVQVQDGTFAGWNDVGGLVGFAAGASISQSTASGSVSGNGEVGGLVGNANGFLDHLAITNAGSSAQVFGSSYVGGLVGLSQGASIQGSHASGAVSAGAGGYGVGGLVGQNSEGSIANSMALGAVSVGDNALDVGGLVGKSAYGASIVASYATGAVSAGNGSANVGGLVGANTYGASIATSFATGTVGSGAGSSNIGGLVGSLGSYGTSIVDSYASGAVSAGAGSSGIGGLAGAAFVGSTITTSYATGAAGAPSSTAIGGLVGINGSGTYGATSPTIINSYWNASANAGGIGSTLNGATVSGGGGLTTAQMMSAASFGPSGSAAGQWDFADTWLVYAGETTPLLRGFLTPLAVTASNITQIYGAATPSALSNPSYTLNGGDGQLFGLSNPYPGAVNAGQYAPALWSDQLGYLITLVGGTLTIKPATLTYVASPAGMTSGGSVPALDGSVTGFVNGQTLASATTGTAKWTTPASAASPAGRYAVDGAGLSADDGNYDFVQASGNATALTINAAPGAAGATGTPPDIDNAVANALLSTPDAAAAEPTPLQGAGVFGMASVATVVDVAPLAGLPQDTPLTFASAPDADGPTQVLSLSQALAVQQGAQGNAQGTATGADGSNADQGSGSDRSKDVRVPASRNSLAQIVNGGVRLPSGVEQQLFVVRGN